MRGHPSSEEYLAVIYQLYIYCIYTVYILYIYKDTVRLV
jgi:hypothetical protein